MDKVSEEVGKVRKEWEEAYDQTLERIKAIEEYGKKGRSIEEDNSLPRLNGLAQDGLAVMSSLQFKLDLLAPQMLTVSEVEAAQSLLESWKDLSQKLRLSLRYANLQAKTNLKKAAQKERELLLGGGEESTIRRRNLQTKAGMTSAAASITESLRRTRQLTVQVTGGERSTSMLMTFEESTGVLKKAGSEYKGHRSLLMRTRNLLSTMQQHGVIDRIILAMGVFCFTCVVLYVVSKHIGVLKLQRTVTAAIKVGMVREPEFRPRVVEDGVNQINFQKNAVDGLEVPLERAMHDEL